MAFIILLAFGGHALAKEADWPHKEPTPLSSFSVSGLGICNVRNEGEIFVSILRCSFEVGGPKAKLDLATFVEDVHVRNRAPNPDSLLLIDETFKQSGGVTADHINPTMPPPCSQWENLRHPSLRLQECWAVRRGG